MQKIMSAAIRQSVILAVVAGVLISSATPLRADEADDRFAVAAAHYDQGRWKLAAEEFQTFLQTFPRDRRRNRCVFFLGETLLQLGKYDDARARFKEYITREPSDKYARAAMFRLGEAAYLAGNYDAAKADLDRFRTKYPQDRLNAFVLPYLGEMALAGGDPAAAVEFFRDALERFPKGQLQDDCLLGLARALEKQNQTQEAERLYLSVAGKADGPLADAAQFHLGALHYATGNHRQAIECFAVFDDRLAQSPWRPNAQLGRGLALLKLDRPAEAAKQFDAVLATDTAGEELFQRAMRGKVQAALQSKNHDTVDRLAAQFERQYPNSPIVVGVRRMAARSLIERKRYAPAVTRLEALLAADRGGTPDLEGRYLLAAAYEGLDRYEDALAALLPVVDAADGPLKADAQLVHGSLLMALKKYAQATRPLEAFLAGKPAGDAEAKALGGLAICCARAGQIEKAKKLYAELIEKHPGSPLLAPTTEHLAEAAYGADDTAWSEELSKQLTALGNSAEYDLKGKLGLGWSQYKAGKLAEAAETFDAVLKNEKKLPAEIAAETAFVRGRALEKLGRDEPALEMYDLVVQRHPTSKQHPDALLAAAQLCGRLKQPRQAAGYYKRLAKDYPRSSKLDSVLYEWAWALRELGKAEQAERLFQRIHEECPQSRFWGEAVYHAALRAFEVKNYDGAGALIDELLKAEVDPRVREVAMDLRGKVVVAEADWPKVREAFESLLEEFPETKRRLHAEYWIAQAYYSQHDYDSADEKLKQLAEKVKRRREPWMAEIPLRRAQILALQNKWDDAYEIAVEIEKDFPDFQRQHEVDYLLGRCLANRADFDAARRAYNRVIGSTLGAKTETAAMAQWMVGETFFHQKNYQNAIREYLRLETLYAYPTWQAAALLQAGKCHELLGEPEPAATLYRRILKVYPQTTFADQAKHRLGNLGKAGGG